MGVTSRLTVPCQLSQKVDVGVTIPIFKEQMNALGFGHLPELPPSPCSSEGPFKFTILRKVQNIMRAA